MLEIDQRNKAMRVVLEIGKNMLINGAETYRVEDSMRRMMTSFGHEKSNIFVVPTCIIITVDDGEVPLTLMERIVPESIDLERISMTNQLSRDITEEKLTLEEAWKEIEKIVHVPMFPEWVRALGAGVAGGFFTLLFNGSTLSALISAIASILTVWIVDFAGRKDLNFFVKNLLGGLAAGMFGILASILFKDGVEMSAVIVGPLMTLVPGVAFANGIRDIIAGDLLSGSTRITEAIFIAIGIAFGMGFALKLFASL